MKVYLTAIVKAKPECVEEVKSILQEMVIHSRVEEACLQYDLFQDAEGTFVFQEIWASQSGLDLHQTQPYLERFKSKSPHLIREPLIIYTCEKIDVQ